MNNKVETPIKLSLEASFYLFPKAPGLSYEEISEICRRLGFLKGEIDDAISNLTRADIIQSFFGSPKYELNYSNNHNFFTSLWHSLKPDPRNLIALSTLIEILDLEIKKYGIFNYSKDTNTLELEIKEKTSASITEIWVAIRLLSYAGFYNLNDDLSIISKFTPQRSMSNIMNVIHENVIGSRRDSQQFHEIYPIVQDIIHRRNEELTISIEPIEAFEEILPELNAKAYIMWWRKIKNELNSLDKNRTPTSTLILTAALCEGALSFLANKLQDSDLTMKHLNKNPKNWKFHELIKSAKNGNSPLIIHSNLLDAQLSTLNENRKRIHPASFFDKTNPNLQVPDFKPEQAEEAINTTKKLLRTIMDWWIVNKQKIKD